MRLKSLRVTALALAVAAVGFDAQAAEAQTRTEAVRLPLPKYDGTLTPYTFELGYPLMTLVYDTLMWRDRAGVARPWLARSVARSNGGRRVTVTLRNGVRWHDGRPLTAADVEFTFGFVARRFHPRFTPQLSAVAQVQALDQRTVAFDLRRPSLGFDDQPLADVPILPRHLWQGLEGGSSVPGGLPVGSGPYRLARAGPRAGYVFRANARYFKARPSVETIRVPVIRQENRTYSALERRRVDMLPISLPEDAAAELGDSFGIRLRSGPLYSGTALVFNLRRPPFNRPGVRRAAARALSLKQIVSNAGPAVAADRGYIHPSSRWASKAVLHRDDPQRAQGSLSRFRLPAVRVLAPESDPARLEAGRRVVLALRRAGAPATLRKLRRLALGRAIGEDGAVPDFDAAIVETPSLASYDPDFLVRVFGSDPRSAPLNYSGYRSPRFEALADRVASAPDRGSRRRAVAAELRLLARDAPAVPLFFSRGDFAYRPAIYDGWVFVAGAGLLDKRSFLAGEAPRVRRAPAESGEDTDGRSGISVLDVLSVLSLVALIGVLGLAAYALLQRRAMEKR
jgi:peptide/nickel transport system substrate-binding protein